MIYKENNWFIDPRHTLAVWEGFTYDYNYPKSDFMMEILTVLFKIGKHTKLLYTNEALDECMLIKQMVNTDKIYNLYDLSKYIGYNFFQELSIYKDNHIVIEEFGYQTTEKILHNLNHPEKSKYKRLIPLKISIHRQSITITLHSDIFFPYVFCPWKWEKKYDDDFVIEIPRPLDFKKYGFDNKLIADANTNRLNILIQEIKSVVTNHTNFNWQCTVSDMSLYSHMYDENGIFL